MSAAASPLFGLTWTLDGREIITAPGISATVREVCGEWQRTVRENRSVSLSQEIRCANPSLSRQGRRLAYSRDTPDYNIWRLDLTGAERKASPPARFISSTLQDHTAEFSPNGKKVVFSSNRSGNDEIWVCDSDGKNAIQVTSMGGPSCGTPRWSPDGEQIVFDSSSDGQWDIYVVAASGGKPRRLTNQPSFEAIASWSRDGKWIYFCSDRTGALPGLENARSGWRG